MFRIDNVTAAPALPAPAAAGTPGYFTNGDPSTNTPRTIVDQDWFNMMQEEMLAILGAADINPDKADRGQVLAAILALIANGLNFGGVFATNGYVSLGPIMIQWGRFTANGNGSTTVNFTTAFPSACFSVVSDGGDTGNTDAKDNPFRVNPGTISTTSFSGFSAIDDATSCTYIAIGH